MDVRDVIKALNDLINAKYPGSKVSNKEIKSPERPSFYIKVINIKKDQIAENYTQRTISFDLIYFSETRWEGYVDLLTKQSELEILFQSAIKVNDKYLEIFELDFNLNEEDYVLNTMFNVVITEFKDTLSIDDKEAIEFDTENAGSLYDMEYLEIGE